jgi:hypothetical protein
MCFKIVFLSKTLKEKKHLYNLQTFSKCNAMIMNFKLQNIKDISIKFQSLSNNCIHQNILMRILIKIYPIFFKCLMDLI